MTSSIAVRSDDLTVDAEEYAAEYAINITFGEKNFSVICKCPTQISVRSFAYLYYKVDTGSSDLWIAQEDFICIDEDDKEVDESECNFGPLYDGEFASGDTISNEILEISYGDGEAVEGPLGVSQLYLVLFV